MVDRILGEAKLTEIGSEKQVIGKSPRSIQTGIHLMVLVGLDLVVKPVI